MAQLNAQDWHKLTAKALSVLTDNDLLSAQLLCAVLQAQLSSAKANTCVTTLRSLQQAISRCHTLPQMYLPVHTSLVLDRMHTSNRIAHRDICFSPGFAPLHFEDWLQDAAQVAHSIR